MKIPKQIGIVITAFIFLLAVTWLFISTKASALSESVDISMTASCKSLVNGASSASIDVASGSNVNLTITNDDNVTTQTISGPEIPVGTYVDPNTKTTYNEANVSVGPITTATTITFTPIPNGTGNQEFVNNCYTGLTPVPSTLILKPVGASTPTPAPTPVRQTTKTPSLTTTTPSTSTPTAATPAAPIELTAVYVDNSPIPVDKTIEFNQSQPLVLSGHTTANAVVTLTIHSTPKTVTTTANASGIWSYTVSGLAAGNHYIEASVTDPTTKQVSTATKLVSFKVDTTPTAAVIKKSPTTKNSDALLAGGVVAGLLLAAVLVFIFRGMKSKKLTNMNNTATQIYPVTTSGSTIQSETDAETNGNNIIKPTV